MVSTGLAEVMARLEAAGTAQNRKVYARHGAAEPMFGVSYAELGRVHKLVKTDHKLAEQLWDSGNHDARVLALRAADPIALTKPLADRWLSDVDNYILAEGLGGLCARSPLARELSDAWRDSPGEWEASAGWFIVTCTAEDRSIWSPGELPRPAAPDRGRDPRATQPGASRDERSDDRHGPAGRQLAPLGASRRPPHRPGGSGPRPDRLQDTRSGPLRGEDSGSPCRQSSTQSRQATDRLEGRAPLRRARMTTRSPRPASATPGITTPGIGQCRQRPAEYCRKKGGIISDGAQRRFHLG